MPRPSDPFKYDSTWHDVVAEITMNSPERVEISTENFPNDRLTWYSFVSAWEKQAMKAFKMGDHKQYQASMDIYQSLRKYSASGEEDRLVLLLRDSKPSRLIGSFGHGSYLDKGPPPMMPTEKGSAKRQSKNAVGLEGIQYTDDRMFASQKKSEELKAEVSRRYNSSDRSEWEKIREELRSKPAEGGGSTKGGEAAESSPSEKSGPIIEDNPTTLSSSEPLPKA